MGLADIENLLKETMGLNVASIGSPAVARAVQERLSACHLPDLGAYWNRIRASESELQQLVETVVVPETWFFRDRESFTVLARLVRDEWLSGPRQDPVRLLSLPCSTGEEPYSMAMALLDAGVPADRFHIDAVDISARVLSQAGRGMYGRNSFRGQDLAFRDRHFRATADGYRLSEAVCQQVRFQQGNLFDGGLLPGVERRRHHPRGGVGHPRAEAAADDDRCAGRRAVGDRLAVESRFRLDEPAAGVRVSERERRAGRAETEGGLSDQAAVGRPVGSPYAICAPRRARDVGAADRRASHASAGREPSGSDGRHRRSHAARRSGTFRGSRHLL